MFSGVTTERFLNLTPEEKRLLGNVKTAYEDFVREFVARHYRQALGALLTGFGAGATLYDALMDNPISRSNDKKKYVQLFDAETPKNPEVVLRDRRDGKKRPFAFGEIIYAVRCAFAHAYEDLDVQKDGIDCEVRLDWRWAGCFARPGWTMPVLVHPGDNIVLNAFLLMEKISWVLVKLVFCIEGVAMQHEIEVRTERLRQAPPAGPYPIVVGEIKSSLPNFFDILEHADITRRVPMTKPGMRG